MFNVHTDCQLCPLHQTARNPGLPTRTLYDGQPVIKRVALLFVGQSPGHQEDMKGKSFVGYTGQLLEKLVRKARLTDYADVYLANSCQCKPPQGADESQANIRACLPYLQDDVVLLGGMYEEVIIVALGAKAAYSTTHLSSLGEALKKQGQKSTVFDGMVRVFCTFHPAILHPLREPGKIFAVETHFSLILRYLQGEFIPNELQIEPEVGIDPPQSLPPFATMDIETYGILEGKEQTVFHPIKSKEIDGIPFEDQIVTVSFGWRGGIGGQLRTAQYVWSEPTHRPKIRLWFRRICEQKVVLVGQNIKFDLLYLYLSQDPELPYWISQRKLTLDDTLLVSFLLYEQQPEKGLKELATLFGIADYSEVHVTGKSGNAKSPWDKDLHYYNCLDTAATLVLYEELLRRIKERYGLDSPKLSKACAWTRNMILWDTFYLEATGSSFDVAKLQTFHKEESIRCKNLLTSAETDHGIKLCGTGSDAPLRQLLLDCLLEARLMDDSRVEWTGKTKKISIGVENVNLILEHIPDGKNKQLIAMFQDYKERSKLVSTYTGPLLTDPQKGIMAHTGNVGMVYPTWYAIPMYSERGGSSDAKSGGQIQGRFSCKKPARQTEPHSIRDCSCSRWPGGKIVEYDVNQDHLRMAALLSGDPLLMEAYTKEGESIHTRTALTLFPNENPVGFKKREPVKYALGKTLNFLVLFRGGAEAFQSTARRDAGIEVDIEFCDRAIKTWYAKHHVYKAWQDEMIALAGRQGYLVLPTGWSRTFGVGCTAGKGGEICNFLHQTPCAQLMHSAQYRAKARFMEANLRSVICLQIHDALFVDTYPAEGEQVDAIMDDCMKHPPLLDVFSRWVGRTVPWDYERKENK